MYTKKAIVSFHAINDGDKFIVEGREAYDASLVNTLNEGEKWHKDCQKAQKTDKPSDSGSKVHRKIVAAVTVHAKGKANKVNHIDAIVAHYPKMTIRELQSVILFAKKEIQKRG